MQDYSTIDISNLDFTSLFGIVRIFNLKFLFVFFLNKYIYMIPFTIKCRMLQIPLSYAELKCAKLAAKDIYA